MKLSLPLTNSLMLASFITPWFSIGQADILLLSASLREIATVIALMDVAREAQAKTMVITAQPSGKAPQQGNVVIPLPAQTMANDTGETAGLLQIGSLFETAQLIFFDFVSIVLREKLKQSADEMRRRPTNLD
jgi:6-phospho-3-hexuloisomerase